MTGAWQAMIAALVANALFAVGQIYWVTMLQRLVPSRLLGRVSSVDWLLSIGLIPVSFAVAGTLGAVVNPRLLIVVASLIGSVVMLALLFVPGVRDPEQAAEVRTTSSPEPAEASS
jgi:DHA3 family tetracycline resistance protein-like MFS transporter